MPRSTVSQECGVRRRSLESAMKEPPARTKVVLRHLPPSLSQGALLDAIHAKYADRYTWFSFHPGKAGHKRQTFSQAYINFKKSEDVFDFFDDFNNHIFVNERGAQCKVSVEYAPYQRVPKARSKKDVREGTITRDPDYVEFLEMLARPTEFLPSAEVQLERREAEKAAALAAGGPREVVVVTPLMEFVRQKRAAKATPQRSLSSKLGPRAGGVAIASLNLASHKRSLERSRSGPLMKESKDVPTHILTSRREEQQQRTSREMSNDRRKKEQLEVKEKKSSKDNTTPSVFLAKGSSITRMEGGKDRSLVVSLKEFGDSDVDGVVIEASGVENDLQDHGFARLKAGGEASSMDTVKEYGKREVLRRKQPLLSKEKLQKDTDVLPSSSSVSASSGGAYGQKHRASLSPRLSSPGTPGQQGSSTLYVVASGDGNTPPGLPKSSHRREPGKNFSRCALSPREQTSSAHQVASVTALSPSDSLTQSQQSASVSERAGKRPPRPQSSRATGREPALTAVLHGDTDPAAGTGEEKVSGAPLKESFSINSGSEKQDSRRVRNKDRPDRAFWTPRRRADASNISDGSSSWVPLDSPLSESALETIVSLTGAETMANAEKVDGCVQRQVSKGVDSNSGDVMTTAYHASGQWDGGKVHTVSGSPHGFGGKVRYVESGSTRSSRGGRSSPASNLVLVHGEQKVDALSGGVEAKSPFPGNQHHERENGDVVVTPVAEKDRRKHDIALTWNELSGGGGHRTGGRRERALQQVSKDGDAGSVGVESIKPVRRSGSLALGGNERQVWIAVQKSGSGT